MELSGPANKNYRQVRNLFKAFPVQEPKNNQENSDT